MDYKVYDEKFRIIKISDEELKDKYKENEREIPIEFIRAFGLTHESIYLKKLYEALLNDKYIYRISAVYSILSIENTKSLTVLKEREKVVKNINDNNKERTIINAAIIRLEEGGKGAYDYFFDNRGIEQVKAQLVYNYKSGLKITLDDILFLIDALESYVYRTISWIKKIKIRECEDAIIEILEALWTAGEQGNYLSNLDQRIYEKLCRVCESIFNMKIDSYAKEVVVIVARFLPEKYAKDILKSIVGHAKGDILKELRETLRVLNEKEVRI
ncbi:hypothetical protein [Clostridium butyricum]|uniref:hypothetical protein n=1 Tax=Clostridium butyricum TaxID=1492 RepID=UPI0032C0CDF4